MPLPLPSRTPSGPRRRSLLASAAGAALLVGCSSGAARREEDGGGTSGDPSVAERARARAAQESNGLVARYDAVLAGHPALAVRLAPLRAEVAGHVEAFGGVRRAPATPAPSPSTSPASPTASGSAPAAVVPVAPVTEQEALSGLAAAERALADRRAAQLLDVPGELARLLASVAAAGAAHAYLLTEGAR
ncbi:hypothetical protein SAMN04487983_103037 [Streptomyces sp. yr375]|uniref:hypothetical protein n=1 Tax=Streptomyces sp. yr375 TaxID=1761906 RepID=UPI0008BC4A45|nr:hypothetical protein [Streptomyces sp. yr375]SES07377.1 hypothetical protein SAMN04487983_103037 [Streptomyces sp. yr375]